MKVEKEFNDSSSPIQLGPAPIQWSRKLKAVSTSDTFLLDFYRGNFEISRYTVNHRYQQTIVLLRYDSGGRHTNPDGETFDGPHVHLFKEGFRDKFAYPVSKVGVEDSDNLETVFNKLMHFCNVRRIPSIKVPMF